MQKQKFKGQDIYDDLKCSERPRKVYGRDFRHLKRLVKGCARSSTTKITSDMNASLTKNLLQHEQFAII